MRIEESKIDNIFNHFEIESLFDNLKLVGTPKKVSLDKILEDTITEGERFITWKKSGKPLTNIQFFNKIDDQPLPITRKKRTSFHSLFNDTIKLEIRENSQLEIWECDKDDKPSFPLYRLPLFKVSGAEPLSIDEKLRDDCFIRIQAKKKKDHILFNFSMRDLSQNVSLIEGIYFLIKHYKRVCQKQLQLIQPQIAHSLLVILLLGCFWMTNLSPDETKSNTELHISDQLTFKNSNNEEKPSMTPIYEGIGLNFHKDSPKQDDSFPNVLQSPGFTSAKIAKNPENRQSLQENNKKSQGDMASHKTVKEPKNISNPITAPQSETDHQANKEAVEKYNQEPCSNLDLESISEILMLGNKGSQIGCQPEAKTDSSKSKNASGGGGGNYSAPPKLTPEINNV